MQEKASVVGTRGLVSSVDGFKALVILSRRYDVRTQSGMLQDFKEVTRPKEVKYDKDVVHAIHEWERKVVALQTRYKEAISDKLKTALMI